MANADAERMMRLARARLPGALDELIQAELYNVADEFFKQSSAWQQDIDFTTAAADDDYVLAPSTGNLVRLVQVLTADSVAVDATLELPATIRLRWMPTRIETLTATVVMSVSKMDADNLPDIPAWVWDRHSEDFLDGVVGRMMTQKMKPYTDERLGVYHMRRFRNGMAMAKVAATHRNIEDGQRWRFPAGW